MVRFEPSEMKAYVVQRTRAVSLEDLDFLNIPMRISGSQLIILRTLNPKP